MRDDAELDERVGLRTDHALHLVEMNDVEAVLRMALQPAADLAPEIAEARGVDPRAEFRGEQRAVIVAQRGAEPGQPPRKTTALDAERQEKHQLTIGVAAGDDDRLHAVALADVVLPERHPAVAL